MYFVDRNKIEEILAYMDELLELLDGHNFSTTVDNLARERIVHILIESTLDVGNMMIDGFIMRDPGSYEDIIDILMDERVISGEEGAHIKEIILLRKMLTQDYIQMNHDELYKTIQKHIAVVEKYPANIHSYLEKELGPASAFVPE